MATKLMPGRDAKSVWFCLRCGRAQVVEHAAADSPALVRHLAEAQHEARRHTPHARNTCATDSRCIAIDVDSTDITALRIRSEHGELHG